MTDQPDDWLATERERRDPVTVRDPFGVRRTAGRMGGHQRSREAGAHMNGPGETSCLGKY